jgi:prepilin-type N-terminal cleavage/methylation domain-containing protein
MKNKGFTLIELLVVIAIIGILSGTVIVSMSGAQNSAKDARVKAGMDQLRATAEIFRIQNNIYTGFTLAGTDGAALVADISSQAKTSASFVSDIADTNYCFSVTLNNGNTMCIDNKGHVFQKTGSCSSQVCSGS